MSSALAGLAASRRRSAGGAAVILGNDVKTGSSAIGMVAGRSNMTVFTLASAGTLNELHGWFACSGSAVGNVRVVIYADSSGSPGARKAYTSSYNLPIAGGDVHVSETGFSVALAAGNYWVGWISDPATGAGSAYAINGVGSYKGANSGVSYSPPPDPFGTAGASGTRNYCCWGVLS